MSRRLSRRSFLSAAGALALPVRAASNVPAAFDHMLLGCGDLEKGIAFVEQKLGVQASFGGVHPDVARATPCSRSASADI